MTVTSNLATLAVVAAGVVVGLAAMKARLARRGDEPSFRAKALLTPNELEFLARLESAVPDLRFCPQVAMGALLEPAVPRSNAKAYYRLRGMFSQKIVDFVAVSRETNQVVAIIELDDRTHDAGKDARRDELLKSAGYRTVRWSSKAKPDAQTIRATLIPPAAPAPANTDTKDELQRSPAT